ERVEDVDVGRGIQEDLVFVLTVEIDKDRGQIAERGTGSECAVDEGAASALRGDLPPQDDLLTIGLVENRLDDGGVLPRPDEVRRGPAAQQETDGTVQNGLPCPGLSGQDVQARLELQLEVVDHGEIAD